MTLYHRLQFLKNVFVFVVLPIPVVPVCDTHQKWNTGHGIETCKSRSQTQEQQYPETRYSQGGYAHGTLSLRIRSGRHV